MTNRPNSKELFHEACEEFGLKEDVPTHVQLNDYNPIDILKCRK